MRHIKLYEGFNTKNITDVIKELVERYMAEYNNHGYKSAYDLNNGLCMNIADDIAHAMTGEDVTVLGFDMFFTEDEGVAEENDWGELIESPFGFWSKRMFSQYGYPPRDLDLNTFEAPQHWWVSYKDKHYDAECPQGVDNWHDLPIVRRAIQYTKTGEWVEDI
jgi:hypothetical protein